LAIAGPEVHGLHWRAPLPVPSALIINVFMYRSAAALLQSQGKRRRAGRYQSALFLVWLGMEAVAEAQC
jgi:hypothetical protein